jgi:hypothetical protein
MNNCVEASDVESERAQREGRSGEGQGQQAVRMGYSDFGNIAIADVGAHYVFHHDAGCRQYGFRLQRTSNGAPAFLRG